MIEINSQHHTALISRRDAIAMMGLLVMGCAPLRRSRPSVAWVERDAFLMGTSLRLSLSAATEREAWAASEAAIRECERMDGLLSTWREDSALAQLNEAPAGTWVALPAELYRLLERCLDWSARTGGAFDPVVGALIDAWDLRGSGTRPSDARRTRAVRASGRNRVELVDGRARRLDPDSWIDSGGFGKGAALDAMRWVLTTSGVTSALLDFGGQVLALGNSRESKGWHVEVADPVARQRGVATLSLRDVSAATSSASERFVDAAGERFGHIIDARTGWPVPAWGSATVVAEDAFEADVLSTALFVMGPEAAYDWAVANGVAALFLVPSGDRARERWTPSAAPYRET